MAEAKRDPTRCPRESGAVSSDGVRVSPEKSWGAKMLRVGPWSRIHRLTVRIVVLTAPPPFARLAYT